MMQKLFTDIEEELARGREKFKKPDQVLIALAEEYGEMHQAILQMRPEDGARQTNQNVYEEGIQTICMLIRFLTEGDSWCAPLYKPETVKRKLLADRRAPDRPIVGANAECSWMRKT